jgi:transketolase
MSMEAHTATGPVALAQARTPASEPLPATAPLEELAALLRVKECELRDSLLVQCEGAVDRGIHSGGSQSAILPLLALYYGGTLRYDAQNPASLEQDLFVLSKGHAIAALAAVYADVGFFSPSHLRRTRGWGCMIKGHPGPVIPGVPAATGPLGQGISLACGYALYQKEHGAFDVYCMAGDGELQEGACWEGIQFAGECRLDNLCLLIDKNNGQGDDTHKLLQSADQLGARLSAFGFRVFEAESANMPRLLKCLRDFRSSPRDSRPSAIICETYKGFGGHSIATAKHKAGFSDAEIESERSILRRERGQRIRNLRRFRPDAVKALAKSLRYSVSEGEDGGIAGLEAEGAPVCATAPAPRDKRLRYDASRLPAVEAGRQYGMTELTSDIAEVFAADPRFYTIDADLSNVSGLWAGTARTNRLHALNVGIAECNMMCVAESLASCGASVWVSTFGPFFNWQAFRRIAISYQERGEAMEQAGGWLSRGHNLDIVFLSTAANLDTAVNGATHMSNDDAFVFGSLAHVSVIDVCCPRQFLAACRWIAEGNRGLVYLRIMRNPTPALYGSGYEFEYGKASFLRGGKEAGVAIISSGHAVHESLAAADLLERDGIEAAVADMPSYDGGLLRELAEGGATLLFAEQNNGMLLDRFGHDALLKQIPLRAGQVRALNARGARDELRFIQSGSYEQLVEGLGLAAKDIALAVRRFAGPAKK